MGDDSEVFCMTESQREFCGGEENKDDYWSQEGDSISLAQPDYTRAYSQATPDYDSIASFSQPCFIQKSNPEDTRNNRKHHNNSMLHKAKRKLVHMKVEEIVKKL